MELIKPSEIAARIMTLLDESDERVIIVSPYMKIASWYKLKNKLNDLKSREIPLEIYVRDDPGNTATYDDLDSLELVFTKIPNLHSKLYMNEKQAIVTSLNLLISSEINSKEVGHITENQDEYDDLWEYFRRYIQPGKNLHYVNNGSLRDIDFKKFIADFTDALGKDRISVWPYLENTSLHVSTGRNYFMTTINEGILRTRAEIRISSKLKQSDGLKKMKDLTAMDITLVEEPVNKRSSNSGAGPVILKVRASAKHALKSQYIFSVLEDEAPYVIESLRKLIIAMEDLSISINE